MKSDTPLVSIITPVFNGARYLDQLIQSVHEQDYPRVEHLVINDGSTDDGATFSILQRYPHLRYWSRENRGQYATMNEGLDAASGELVCFISADDLMAPNAIKTAVEFLQTNPDFDGVYGKYTWVDENNSLHRFQPVLDRAPIGFYQFYPFIAHCSLYLRTDTLKKQNMHFDSALSFVGDYDFLVRITNGKFKIGYVNCILSKVRYHKDQMSNRNTHAMANEQKMVKGRYHVNPFIYSAVFFGLFWVSIWQRVAKSTKENGLSGLAGLVKDWQKRRHSQN